MSFQRAFWRVFGVAFGLPAVVIAALGLMTVPVLRYLTLPFALPALIVGEVLFYLPALVFEDCNCFDLGIGVAPRNALGWMVTVCFYLGLAIVASVLLAVPVAAGKKDPRQRPDRGPDGAFLSILFSVLLALVTLLIRHGAAIDARDSEGRTALHLASNVACAKVLLTSGANVNARSHNGATALVRAAGGGDLEMVKLLLAAGADPSLPRWEATGRMTPLAAAEKYRHPEVAELLRARLRRSARAAPHDSLAGRAPRGDAGSEDCHAV